MDSNNLQSILKSGDKDIFPKGLPVHAFDESKRLNLVTKGYIKRYLITDSGQQSIQVIYGPGDIFPLTPVYKLVFDQDLSSSRSGYYYETIMQTTAYSIHQSQLAEYLDQEQGLYKDLLAVAGERLESNIQRLDNMAIKGAGSRLAHLLIYLGKKFGQDIPEGIEIQLPLTHQTLAYCLNMARETVSNEMARLARKDLITNEKSIKILDANKLQREV